jgi:hypothetical protein
VFHRRTAGLKLLGLFSFIGGPLYLVDRWRDHPYQWLAILVVMAPLLALVVGAYALQENGESPRALRWVGIGVVGAIFLALENAIMLIDAAIDRGPIPDSLNWFGLVVGLGAIAAYAYGARRYFRRQRERPLLPLRECPACSFESPDPACPRCGYAFDGVAEDATFEGLRIAEEGDRLRVHLRPQNAWLGWIIAPLPILFAAGGWWTMLQGAVTTIPIALMCAVSAACLVVVYALIAAAVNEIELTLDRSFVSAARSPLPWPTFSPIDVSAIEEVYFDTIERRGPVSFQLHARLSNGEHRVLLAGLASGAAAQHARDRVASFVAKRAPTPRRKRVRASEPLIF